MARIWPLCPQIDKFMNIIKRLYTLYIPNSSDFADVSFMKHLKKMLNSGNNVFGEIFAQTEQWQFLSNGNFLGFFNEACWVDGYAEVAGMFDLQLLMRFNCMNITGAVFKS